MENFFNRIDGIFIIAEIGVNHNGDVRLAKEIIDQAQKTGVDAVKIQSFTAQSLALPKTPKVQYQKLSTGFNETQYEMLRRLELSKASQKEIKEYCDERGVRFLSTPYDIDSARFLQEDLNIPFFKTASADITDLLLHKYLASTSKPVIISTGMATLGEIEEVLGVYETAGSRDICLLHCVSNYPCRDESINLKVIPTLRRAFGMAVGYSDHSVDGLSAVLSASFGVKVIERHFTISKDLEGPDHRTSSDFQELTKYVRDIRRAEIITGSPVKRVQVEEREMRQLSRKSIVLIRSIQSGEVIKSSDLVLMRPGNGIPARDIAEIVGRRAAKNLEAWSQIKLSDLK